MSCKNIIGVCIDQLEGGQKFFKYLITLFVTSPRAFLFAEGSMIDPGEEDLLTPAGWLEAFSEIL